MFIIFALLAFLPRVVVLAHLGRSRLAARLFLVHRVIPQPFRHPHEVLWIIRQLRHLKYQLTRPRLQPVDKLQMFIVIRHMLEGAYNPLELPHISFNRMCLPLIQPRHSCTMFAYFGVNRLITRVLNSVQIISLSTIS